MSTYVGARHVFVTGATGYIGSHVVPALIERGHRVRALVRPESTARAPAGADVVQGNALDANTFAGHVAPCDTLLHLVGTPHPSPSKAKEFERVDLASVAEATRAARLAGVSHFIYLSVARPAPVMQAYQSVRARGEGLVQESGIPATFLRPWYVLGPGHRWPYLLLPMYGAASLLPGLRDGAQRLGLVSIGTMVRAIVRAVETPTTASPRVWDVPALRDAGRR